MSPISLAVYITIICIAVSLIAGIVCSEKEIESFFSYFLLTLLTLFFVMIVSVLFGVVLAFIFTQLQTL